MARPIEPTPKLKGEDAERLLRDLADVCSPEERERRVEMAKRERAKLMGLSGGSTGGDKTGAKF